MVKNMQKTCTIQETFYKISYFKSGLSKNLEKVKFIFILKPAPFYEHCYEKHKGPRISYQ